MSQFEDKVFEAAKASMKKVNVPSGLKPEPFIREDGVLYSMWRGESKADGSKDVYYREIYRQS
ncbi:hypothetical protein [Brevibacillus dissolubilis]|uniref:hypothetical protein n=1 Tax=Brevibacillus dissolubilis TaxID=1844116 RepID=UPI0011168ECB|nr:hypothetical protein [Brevibacillus dissolubilis]